MNAALLRLAVAAIGFSAALYGAPDVSKLPPAATRPVDFVKDVRPVLDQNCYECHGAKKQEAGLRLDLRSAALKGSDSGPVIIAGKSVESPLILALCGLREDVARMPKKRDPLEPETIALLRAWVDQGANWPENLAGERDPSKHWAFKAPAHPALPKVGNESWVRNPIDAFVLARLEREKLQPSPRADKVTLLRRLSLDLIGLPPTVEDVDAFLADQSEDAYREQVERLLRSPHYGERWGRHWLDAARYADSDGFEKDKSRNVWFYRDWVINSLNKDLPYDQFIIQQLAGDLLPGATQDQIVATGFLRNSMVNEEGGVDPEQFRMDAMFDRMDAIGKSFLGLTIQCAQCHSHKFDPLTQEEYYRMFAFLNNDHEPQRIVYTVAEQMKRDELSRRMKEIEARLKESHSDWREKMSAWEEKVRVDQPEWTIIQPVIENISDGGQKYLPQPDGSFLAQGYAPTHHTARFWITNDFKNISAFRIELLTDPNLPANGPGRSFKGTCALSEFKVEAADAKNPTNKFTVKFASATADFDQPEAPLEPNFYDKTDKKRVTGPVRFAIDGNPDTAWGIDAGPGRRNQERKAVFQCATNFGFPDGTILTIHISQNHGGWNSDDHMNNNLGRFRLAVSSASKPVADPLPKRVRDILAIAKEKRSKAQEDAVFSYWRTTVSECKTANDEIETLWKEWPAGSTALTLMARAQPRETHMLKRGDFLKPGKTVPPGVPAFLHRLPADAPPTRLTFARWVADRRSPTTARVFVNRIWQAYFGSGLVATPEDFGMQSEAPSHPELLDWLATEFMDHGWSIKEMHRLIVNSATYQQSSRVTPDLYERDQYNRLLARGPRFRVEGEIVRDIALAASGLLNPAVGGRSVMPPAPAFLFMPPVSYAPFPWAEETGPDRYRRAIYTFRRRSTPYPMLQTFDAPNGDVSCVRRARSNTPLQALMTLNETLFMECSRALALRILEKGGSSDDERVTYAFRRALSRNPEPDEKAELLNLLKRQKERIADGWVHAAELATGKIETPAKLPAHATPTQLAAYTVVARVLLNLDETITAE